MANVVISGDTSGSVVLTVPAIAGTSTFTLQGPTGTLVAGGPAFYAQQQDHQYITSNTYTKVQFPIEIFDTNNNYDPNANYRFTPTVAGYYLITANVYFYAASGFAKPNLRITKNGNANFYSTSNMDAYISMSAAGTLTDCTLSISGVLYANGSTDYFEIFGKVTGTTPEFYGGAFTGCLLRGE